MKNTIFTLIIFLFSLAAYPQLAITNSTDLYIEPGTTLYVTTGLNSDNATIWNYGTIDLKGNLENNSGSLFEATSTGTFKFSGTTAQEITGDHDAGFYGITEIDNTYGLSLNGTGQTVNGELKFTNGKLTLNTFNLLLGAVEPTGFSADNYVLTNNSGILRRNVPADGVSTIYFPVGNSSYNPVFLKNSPSATTDIYGVRVEDQEPAGLETHHFVDRSWIITEEVPDGSALTVIPQWIMGEELTGFNRNLCAVGLVADAGPVYEWKTFGAAAGDDPWYREGEGFTDVGTFTVGDITNTEDPGNFKLRDSQYNLLAGGTLKYYDAGWKTATEISDGVFDFDTEKTRVSLRMYYSGGMQQVNNVTVSEGYIFFTEEITVELIDSYGAGLSGGLAKYYASGWKTFGTTDGDGQATKELLPVSYSFRMYYEGAMQQISNQHVASDPVVNFATIEVTAELLDSEGVGLSGGDAKYYASGWKTFGTTDGNGLVTKELLPVSYSFRMYYEGAMKQISNQNVSDDPIVNFETIEVTVELLDSDDSGLSGGDAKYYASGWKVFGTTDGSGQVSKELLPVSYSFRMYYEGAMQQISNQNVASDPVVNFATIEVTAELLDDQGDGISGGEAKYYASGWNDFGTTNDDGQSFKELLPVTYSFRMYYEGNMQQISNHNTGNDPVVTFYEEDLKNALINSPEDLEFVIFPNPFRGQATILLTPDETASTTLRIYNTEGLKVAGLFEGIAEAGHHYKFTFNGHGLPQGIYIVHLQSGNKVSILKKIILIK